MNNIPINIHPLDLEEDIAIGILLNTTHPNGKVFISSYTTIDQAKTNILNLLFTNEGERIMQPLFGCGIKRMLFEQITPSLISRMDSIIRDKIRYWLPYVQILDLQIEPEHDLNIVNFHMEFCLKGNEFDRSSITFQLDVS
jgi:phage baseplate assembly protein W